MKKPIQHVLFLIVAIALYFPAQAQFGPQKGIKAGLNMATMKIERNGVEQDNKLIPSPQVGFMIDWEINESMGIQSSLDIQGRGFRYKASGSNVRARMLYIQMPLLFRYTHKIFFVCAGPNIARGFTGRYHKDKSAPGKNFIDFGNDESNDDFKALEFGAMVEAGVQLPTGMRIGASFSNSLNNLSVRTGKGFSAKHRLFAVTIGYWFGEDY